MYRIRWKVLLSPAAIFFDYDRQGNKERKSEPRQGSLFEDEFPKYGAGALKGDGKHSGWDTIRAKLERMFSANAKNNSKLN